jgi:hypothetical protein
VSEQEINPLIGEAFWRAIITGELLKEKASLQPLTAEEALIFDRAITVARGIK